jgi:hypothetical protein
MKTCYTAIISAYEELKPPSIISKGWKYICFTDQPLESDVWEIHKVSAPGSSPQRTARMLKILFHHFIDTKYSLWVDASFQINIDLNIWWQRFEPPMTCVSHPLRSSVYEEAKNCIAFNRGNKEEILKQMARYRQLQVPNNYGMIQSGILMREKTPEVIKLCELWHCELQRGSTRDQLSFPFAAMNYPIVNYFNWDYRKNNEFLYSKHFKYRK